MAYGTERSSKNDSIAAIVHASNSRSSGWIPAVCLGVLNVPSRSHPATDPLQPRRTHLRRPDPSQRFSELDATNARNMTRLRRDRGGLLLTISVRLWAQGALLGLRAPKLMHFTAAFGALDGSVPRQEDERIDGARCQCADRTPRRQQISASRGSVNHRIHQVKFLPPSEPASAGRTPLLCPAHVGCAPRSRLPAPRAGGRTPGRGRGCSRASRVGPVSG